MSQLGTKILGTGSYAPEKVLDNKFFVKNSPYKIYIGQDKNGEPIWKKDDNNGMILTHMTDESIRRNNGIKERRRAAPNETTLDMAREASLKALEDANMEARKLKAIIVACVTQDRDFPSLACELQRELNAVGVTYAIDVSAGCAGSVHALGLADKLIRYDDYGPCLVAGLERLTGWTDYTERNCTLFGDGAGAIVLVPGNDSGRGVLATQFYSDTDSDKTEWLFSDKYRLLRMPKGPEVMRLGVKNMVKAANSVITKVASQLGISYEEMNRLVAYYFPHQANSRILNAVEARVGPGKVYKNIEFYGNTSAATWMIAVDEARRKGVVKVGDYIVITTFGSGFATGGALIKL